MWRWWAGPIPILPSPRYLDNEEIQADRRGNPILDQKLFLLSITVSELEVKSDYPRLWKYLQLGIEQKINEGYICSHRTPWFSQEDRPSSPFLCTYMGRPSGSNKYTEFHPILPVNKLPGPSYIKGANEKVQRELDACLKYFGDK